jgi:pyrimidine-nucleoside phosphorylase
MNMYDIIYRKREGEALSREEIEFFVSGYTDGSIPDYQASALLMAIFFRKMNREETYELTKAMKHSGDVVDLSGIKGVKVDKHSTGGVGDKTTLVVGPLAAACGVPIAKMSGRGLGFTGGTVDKMEAIPGFRTTLEAEEFIALVNRVGLSVIGQTAHIAPADKKLYALRDVTATVDDLSLITSSVMSKKLASGSDAIVLDVKCGSGAFMERFGDACELGELMVEIGKADGKKTIAVVTDMSQPLGFAVGNSLEVIEAIETLKGKGPKDITELALHLASHMIYVGEKAVSPEEGYRLAKQALESGAALEKLAAFIEGQGGDPKVIDDYSLFPQASCHTEIPAGADGYVCGIEARSIGLASQHSGAGRATKEDSIDLAAGIVLHKKVGDAVRKGELLATVYGNDQIRTDKGAQEAAAAFRIQDQKPEETVLIKKVIQ